MIQLCTLSGSERGKKKLSVRGVSTWGVTGLRLAVQSASSPDAVHCICIYRPCRSLKRALHMAKEKDTCETKLGKIEAPVRLLAGAVSGLAVLIVGQPFDTVKVRQQVKQQRALHTLQECIRLEGLAGLYKGNFYVFLQAVNGQWR